MKISNISLKNFRIYKGHNNINFDTGNKKNISLIAGRNGYGKTTFLTALVWAFYGKLMSQVEDKYRKDIKSAGGYENYLDDLFNHSAKNDLNKEGTINAEDEICYVKIELDNVSIPSIPCEKVTIIRSFNIKSKEENLKLLIDGSENELTKDVGYEIFINDFILPREIAKFFFFDAEKIVSLAEARSKNELRNLSRAYSEVLGIKKYDELRKNLESLLSKLRRNGGDGLQREKLLEFENRVSSIEDLIAYNQDTQDENDFKVNSLKAKSDRLQEKLIREGNSLSLEELKELKLRRDSLKEESEIIKRKLRKNFDLAPLLLAGRHLVKLDLQVKAEAKLKSQIIDPNILNRELELLSDKFLNKIKELSLDTTVKDKLSELLEESLKERTNFNIKKIPNNKILLDFSEEKLRKFQSLLSYLKTSYIEDFSKIIQEEKNNRIIYNGVLRKIKQGEVRKNNHLAKKIREEKDLIEKEITLNSENRVKLIQEFGALTQELNSIKIKKSEFEKNFKLQEVDEKKYNVTEQLLFKINSVVDKIKNEKKFSLQKAIHLGLKKLMHKDNFIAEVKVTINEDVMDIDLIDDSGAIINKDSLSKGEQQLYATALLKALVDESGINFPVFIDSPLQKFDKFHAENIIQEFYPTISDQVVLFPLLEKELSEKEFELIKPNLNQAFLINNYKYGSEIIAVRENQLFAEFKRENIVETY